MTLNPSSSGKPATRRGSATRTRIVEVALALFNEAGLDQVTTAQIAAGAGINEGNLYYYFRTKQALVLAVFEVFEARARTLFAEVQSSQGNPLGWLVLLERWFALTWDFRFLPRDMQTALAMSPELRERARRLSQDLRADIAERIAQLRDIGLIDVPDAEVEPLLSNVWIIGTYWAQHLALHENISTLTQDHLAWGMNQLRSLITPYLAPGARG